MASGYTPSAAEVAEAEVQSANAIAIILEELKQLRESHIELSNQNEFLQNELMKAKEVIACYERCEQEEFSEVPRKIPRQIPMTSNNINSTMTNSSINNSNSKNCTIDTNANSAFTIVHHKKQKKIIQAVDTSIATIKNQLKTNNLNSGYIIQQGSKKSPVKITITDENCIPAIKKSLVDAAISHHEYKWDCEKKRGFIIRGLIGADESDLPAIKKELIEAGLPEQLHLTIFKTGYVRANPGMDHNTLLQLVLPPNTDTSALKNIKHIDHVAVKFEPFKANTLLQCKNCQRFGHSASGCQHAHRCVKCGADHLKDRCPRTSNKAIKLVCCNCGGEHTANNVKECPVAQKVLLHFNSSNSNNTSNINNKNYNRLQIKCNSNSDNKPSSIKASSNRPSSTPAFPPLSNRQLFTNNQVLHSHHKTNNSNNSNTYASVLSSNTNSSLSCSPCSCDSQGILKKLDFIINIVLKHEEMFTKINTHE